MDQLRQIRYLVAPFFFFASIVLGRYLENPSSLLMLSAPILGVVAASFFPIGFLISAVERLSSAFFFGTVGRLLSALFFGVRSLLLRQVPRRRKFRFHEAAFSDETFQRMWEHLGLPGKTEQRFEYFASNAFDHGVVSERINHWLMRAWSGYVMSIDSCVALISAWFVGKCFLEVNPPGCFWELATAVASLLLLGNAALSWYRYTRMLELQAGLPLGYFQKGG
jgi:hypothetical protein